MSAPYDGKCPNCAHEFTLADLGRMATGDGWERYLWVPDDRFQEMLADGTIHPKMKRNDMAVHAAQDSLERVLAFGGSWGQPTRDRDWRPLRGAWAG